MASAAAQARGGTALCLMLVLSACEGVENLVGPDEETPTPAVKVSLFPTSGIVEVERGKEYELVTQALGADGHPVNGIEIYFLRTEQDRVSFAEAASADDDLLRARTEEQTAAGITADGLAVAAIVVAEDAAAGTSRIVSGLTLPPGTSALPDSELLEAFFGVFSVTLPEGQGGGGGASGGPTGGAAAGGGGSGGTGAGTGGAGGGQ